MAPAPDNTAIPDNPRELTAVDVETELFIKGWKYVWQILGIPVTIAAPSAAGLFYGKNFKERALASGVGLVASCLLSLSTRISFGTEIYSGQETEVKEISTTYCSENKIAQYLAQTILAGPTLLVERRPVTGLTLKYRQDTKAWLLGGKNLFQYTNNVYVSTFNPKTPFGEMPTLVDSLADIEGKCNLDLSERATRLRALETQLLSARTNPPSLKVLGNVRSKYLEAKANYKNTQDTCRTKIANKQHQYEAIKVITDAIAIHMTNQKNALTDVEATKY